jgi:hypothetical protein
VIKAILHMMNDQPIVVELLEEPHPSDMAVICTNPRTIDGKKPVFIDYPSSTFLFPMWAIRFVEVVRTAADGDRMSPAVTDQPAEPEDLEIDEDFLRRVREAG